MDCDSLSSMPTVAFTIADKIFELVTILPRTTYSSTSQLPSLHKPIPPFLQL